MTDDLWRASGEKLENLAPGDYSIEFKPVPGRVTPETKTIPVVSGVNPLVLAAYLPERGASTTASGKIEVNLENGVGAWRLRGDSVWQNSGVKLSGLIPGVYVLEFRQLPGFDAPLSRQVQIPTQQTVTIDEAYTPEAAFGLETPAPLSGTDFCDAAPFYWVGEISTPLGSATGTAVDEHVVLTAASAIWDDHNLRYADEVRWRQHPHDGVHKTKPLRAR